jgi:hypothetical protein
MERWLRGWDEALNDNEFSYGSLPIEVAVGMALELLEEVKELRVRVS